MLETVGNNIRKLRKERNLTQEDLAAAINVTAQAISKWENSVGLPDISQIIPLATFFGVSTDVILGIVINDREDEVKKIIDDCNEKALKLDSIGAWLLLQEALKKYPTNLTLLQESIEYGIELAYKENSTYNKEYGEMIYRKTIKQVDLIAKYSCNTNDVLRAHMIMVLLHSSYGDVESAVKHANMFPWRADMTVDAMCAWINHAFNEYKIEQINLQRCLQQHLFSMINILAMLGNSYESTEDYESALKMYFSALDIINYVFKEDEYVPQLYKVENGNIYCFIARTYIKMNNNEECLKWLEKMVEVEQITIPKKNKDFIVKNKFLDKANVYNFAKIGSINGDNNIVNCLTLSCFKDLEKLDKYQKLLLVAKQIY